MENTEFKLGVEVELLHPFLVVKETLERLGVGSKNRKVISPSCYCLIKKEKFFICHFKELLLLDGYNVDITEADLERRNRIVSYLEKWGCIKPVKELKLNSDIIAPVLIVSYKEKPEFKIVHKYQIGKR